MCAAVWATVLGCCGIARMDVCGVIRSARYIYETAFRDVHFVTGHSTNADWKVSLFDIIVRFCPLPP
jgi:hypothetical protein